MENCHEQLEKLINFFAKTQTSTQTFFVPDAETFKKSFWQETEKVKTAMNGKSLIAGTTGNLELMVHQHQAAIALWLDTIFDADIKKSSNCSGDLASFAIEELEKLLTYIYHRYEVYFNLDERLPEFSLKQFRLSLKGRLSKVRNHLVKECGNEALAELALLPLREFLGDSGHKKISYHFLFYCRRIEKALSTFCNETYSGKEFDDKPLIRLMVRMNYNNQETVDFIVGKIMSDIENTGSHEEKVNRLRFFLKEFKQLAERSDIAFRRSSESLQTQIVAWIMEELDYYTKGSLRPVQPLVTAGKAIAKEEKLHFSISAEVLAILIRASMENKVITNKYKTDVFDYMVNYVSTKQAEILSANSLSKKSYAAERRAKDVAIDTLHRLIKTIHEY